MLPPEEGAENLRGRGRRGAILPPPSIGAPLDEVEGVGGTSILKAFL